ncbi:adenylate/guanylate cyclase domain-containing protein [Streptomyces sp. NPDC026672]|uniref:AAA family ATPase n=1 Tax=unclassified Streptomyces TaxID=2593676 RepID=UPI0033F0703A
MRCAACDGALPANARFCAFCGVPVGPAAPAAAPVEERKVVTVVFCDLVGSTALSGVLDPETLRTVVLRYFDRMRAALEEFGGTVEKFIGDAVMAVFGVPVTHEDDARRALAAALAMLDAVRELNERELGPVFGIRLGVRIGVNTGPAVTSTDVSTRQALVAGETVNIAARLEQNAGEGEVLIGPGTRQAAGAAARTELVGPLRLKGKSAPVTAYRLLGVAEDDPETSRRFDVPFVGRTRELAELDRALADSVAGRDGPGILVVHGEAGMGKTRLVHEWYGSADPGCARGAGRCRPYGERGSLAPLADALRQLLRQNPDLGDTADERAAVGQALAVLADGLLEDGTPNPSVDDTCAAVVEVLRALARGRPVVLVVDDCQWAGDLLLDVLDKLVAELAASPVLFVCVARPDLFDRRPGWAAGPSAARLLALSGLTAAEAGAVADALMGSGARWGGGAEPGGGGGVPGHVLEAAGGNPLHLEHLLAALAEDGGAGYRADGGAGELPTTLQALLGARIGALGRAERVTLDLAAVLGREFTADDVAELAGSDRESAPGGALHGDGAVAGGAGGVSLGQRVGAAVARLGRHRLVGTAEGADGAESALRFSSGLVHEVTYRSMAKRSRAERHERAAALLAERLPDPAVRGEGRAVETGAAVAGHLENAYRCRAELGITEPRTDRLRRAAVRRLVDSGAQALARSDLAWAGNLLGRALELAHAHEPEWTTAARRLAEVHLATGRTDEGRALLEAVLTPTRPMAGHRTEAAAGGGGERGDREHRGGERGGTPGDARHGTRTDVGVGSGDGDGDGLSLGVGSSGERPAGEAGGTAAAGSGAFSGAGVLAGDGVSVRAAAAGDGLSAQDPVDGRDVGRDAARDVEVAHARLVLAGVAAGAGSGGVAEVAEAVLGVFEHAGDELGQARACIRLAQERQFQGRHLAADALLTRGLGHARRSGAEPERALALGAIGISLWRGPEPVAVAVSRGRDLLDRHGERRPTVRLTLNCPLAVLLALQERPEEAETCLARARRLADGLGYAEGAVVLPLFGATVEALAGRTERALALLDEAGAAARALKANGLLSTVARESARLLVDTSRIDEAVARLTESGDLYDGPNTPNTSLNGPDTGRADPYTGTSGPDAPAGAPHTGPGAPHTGPGAPDTGTSGPDAPAGQPHAKPSVPDARASGPGAGSGRPGGESGRAGVAGGPSEARAAVVGGRGSGSARLGASDSADLDGLVARIAAGRGQFTRAVDLSERAVRTAARTDSPVVRAVAWLDRADVLRQAGRREEARTAAGRAVRCFEAKGHLPGARRAAALRDRLAPDPARLPDRTPEGR